VQKRKLQFLDNQEVPLQLSVAIIKSLLIKYKIDLLKRFDIRNKTK